MSVSLFVDDKEEIVVTVFVAQNKNNPKVLYADPEKEGLLEVAGDNVDLDDVEEHKVTFRLPSFGDSGRIFDAGILMDDDNFRVNPNSMRLERICTLLTDWTFTGPDGKKMATTRTNVQKLHPLIAMAIGVELETKLKEVNLT